MKEIIIVLILAVMLVLCIFRVAEYEEFVSSRYISCSTVSHTHVACDSKEFGCDFYNNEYGGFHSRIIYPSRESK